MEVRIKDDPIEDEPISEARVAAFEGTVELILMAEEDDGDGQFFDDDDEECLHEGKTAVRWIGSPRKARKLAAALNALASEAEECE